MLKCAFVRFCVVFLFAYDVCFDFISPIYGKKKQNEHRNNNMTVKPIIVNISEKLKTTSMRLFFEIILRIVRWLIFSVYFVRFFIFFIFGCGASFYLRFEAEGFHIFCPSKVRNRLLARASHAKSTEPTLWLSMENTIFFTVGWKCPRFIFHFSRLHTFISVGRTKLVNGPKTHSCRFQ